MKMKKFEYKSIEFEIYETEKILNGLGEDGWEVISIFDSSYGRIKRRNAVLKREADQLI